MTVESAAGPKAATHREYVMRISRLTIDKLGVKLYDRVSAVLAELVANAYDADARTVVIEAPMGQKLAKLSSGATIDNGYEIVVEDDGHGMTPDEVIDQYLVVGRDRRQEADLGDRSRKLNRRVMGRKGVGKLAPFGICNRLEIISSGGAKIRRRNGHGEGQEGYETAHLILRCDDLLENDHENNYKPEPGSKDGTLSPTRGTKVILRDFNRRIVPKIEDLSRQLAQRFGISATNWRIRLIDNQDPASGTKELTVGELELDTMPGTKITFGGPGTGAVELDEKGKYSVLDHERAVVDELESGFVGENGKFYPLTGWVAFSKDALKDPLMAGIRIYCRGKIATLTPLFNLGSGFPGEYDARSYLMGELEADWLDEGEDLILTDRRNILWSDDLGEKFEAWGQKLVRFMANKGRNPTRKKAWEEFKEVSGVELAITNAYPGDRNREIRDRCFEIARMFGERFRRSKGEKSEDFERIVDLCIKIGPQVSLDDELRRAASGDAEAMDILVEMLRKARVAELASYGSIAEYRVQVIEAVSRLKSIATTKEAELQAAIESAPWILNPMSSPVGANERLDTVLREFEDYYEKRTGERIELAKFSEDARKKRPDFVIAIVESGIQVIEIKRPGHSLTNEEWDRIQLYIDSMKDFLNKSGNEKFKEEIGKFSVIVVCDDMKLSGSPKAAFDAAKNSGLVQHATWGAFLHRTRVVHEQFLQVASDLRKAEVARQ